MRKIIALLVLVLFVFVGCAKTVHVKSAPTDQRSINRSNEAHRDLESKTKE